MPDNPACSSLGLAEFRAGLAALDILPPVVLYDEHWASIVVATTDGGIGELPAAQRRVDVPQFVALCRRARACAYGSW